LTRDFIDQISAGRGSGTLLLLVWALFNESWWESLGRIEIITETVSADHTTSRRDHKPDPHAISVESARSML
jgi:hypothetical protein